jgi:hypothetical protein
MQSGYFPDADAQDATCSAKIIAGNPGRARARLVTPTVSRTRPTYHNTPRIFCQAFEIEFDGRDFKVERQLIDQTFTLHHTSKMLAVLIDDAHLMPIDGLRRLRCLTKMVGEDLAEASQEIQPEIRT